MIAYASNPASLGVHPQVGAGAGAGWRLFFYVSTLVHGLGRMWFWCGCCYLGLVSGVLGGTAYWAPNGPSSSCGAYTGSDYGEVRSRNPVTGVVGGSLGWTGYGFSMGTTLTVTATPGVLNYYLTDGGTRGIGHPWDGTDVDVYSCPSIPYGSRVVPRVVAPPVYHNNGSWCNNASVPVYARLVVSSGVEGAGSAANWNLYNPGQCFAWELTSASSSSVAFVETSLGSVPGEGESGNLVSTGPFGDDEEAEPTRTPPDVGHDTTAQTPGDRSIEFGEAGSAAGDNTLRTGFDAVRRAIAEGNLAEDARERAEGEQTRDLLEQIRTNTLPLSAQLERIRTNLDRTADWEQYDSDNVNGNANTAMAGVKDGADGVVGDGEGIGTSAELEPPIGAGDTTWTWEILPATSGLLGGVAKAAAPIVLHFNPFEYLAFTGSAAWVRVAFAAIGWVWLVGRCWEYTERAAFSLSTVSQSRSVTVGSVPAAAGLAALGNATIISVAWVAIPALFWSLWGAADGISIIHEGLRGLGSQYSGQGSEWYWRLRAIVEAFFPWRVVVADIVAVGVYRVLVFKAYAVSQAVVRYCVA